MQAQPGTGRTLPRMVVVTVGWMEYYAGAENEQPQGGSYNKENVGYESCNFLDLDGHLRGYFRTQFHKINLERIAPEASSADILDKVLVVFGATGPGGQGLKVVGWYRHALVYRQYQKGTDSRRSFGGERFGYYFEVSTSEAVLLPLTQRTQSLHRGADGMVQTSIFYPYDETGRQRNLLWLEQVVDFVNNYQGDNLLLDQSDPGKAAVTAAEEVHEIKRGQGFITSAKVRRAIELRAMVVVEKYFEKDGWTWIDHSANKPYDLLATKGKQKLYVEVKGSQGNGSIVFLTPNEVKWAKKHHPHTVLAVVTGIAVEINKDDIEAKGGKVHLINPWWPDDDKLEPLGFKFYTDLAS